MLVELAYGSQGMAAELPDDAVVVTPLHRRGVADPEAAVRAALRRPVAGPPLREVARAGRRVAIAVCDGTRPQPRRVMLPVLLEELDGVVDLDDVVILVATGTHRGNTPEELEAMLGPEVLSSVRVVNHDARDDSSLADLGRLAAGGGRGEIPVQINREWAAADVRVTTGFVEPHFFAGFSGGPKLIAPGLAGLATTLVLHDARRIGDPRATWGVTEGNPVHDDIRAVAAVTGAHFACDVILNREQQIVAAFGGELFAMHAAACAASRELAMRPVREPFDVVVTTNSGFPLDQNLYQSVKGMSAGAQVVRPGGLIVLASECREGFPEHGGFRSVLCSAPPAELLEAIAARRETVPDQWTAQVQARLQARARVAVRCDGLTDEELTAAHLLPAGDVGGCVAEELSRLGTGASCCVLPQGPQTIPFVSG